MEQKSQEEEKSMFEQFAEFEEKIKGIFLGDPKAPPEIP